MSKKIALAELRGRVPAFAKKIAPIYELLKWGWSDTGIPSEKDIENHIYDQIETVLKEQIYSSTCGGITVSYGEDGDFGFVASMQFMVAEKIFE